ncbi:MAG: hypothetical protein M3347_09730 [Armatimonadota bacterium]|nr:hypothetical protein [Armatimonadota bacterium]
MKHQKWIVGPAALALALGTSGLAMAAPDAGGGTTPKAGKRANRAGRNKRAAAQTVLTPKMLENVLGRTLTEAEKTAIGDAVKAYHESVAKAVGLTTDELQAKIKEYRAAQRAKGGKAGGGAGGATGGGTTTPAGGAAPGG